MMKSVRPDPQDQQVLRDQLGRKDRPVRRDLKVQLVRREPRGQWVCLESEYKDRKALQGQPGLVGPVRSN